MKTEKWSYVRLAEAVDALSTIIDPTLSEMHRMAYRELYDTVLVFAGWTDDEFLEEMERRIMCRSIKEREETLRGGSGPPWHA